jgi:hypothetical protein
MNAGIERRTRQLLSTKIPLAALLLLVIGVQCQPAEAQNEESTGMQAEGAMLPTALPGSENLTLVATVDLALKQNLDIQIANIETLMRQQDRVVARSELLPHASFEVDDSVNRHNLRALLGIQIPIPGVPHTIGPYEAVHVGPSFSAPVFDLTLIREYQASGHLARFCLLLLAGVLNCPEWSRRTEVAPAESTTLWSAPAPRTSPAPLPLRVTRSHSSPEFERAMCPASDRQRWEFP